MGRQILWTDCWTSEGQISPFRICRYGASEGRAVQASSATDRLLGIANSLGAGAAGERTDIIRVGLVEVEYGGTVAVGDLLTADANGRAIATTTAGNRIIGIADAPGVAGDIGWCFIQLGRI